MSDNAGNEINEFYGLIEKIDRKNPDKADIKRAESLTREFYPEVCALGMGMAGSMVKQFLEKLNPQKSQQLFFESETLNIKKELGYLSSNQLEKLIIDQIMLCWVGMNHVEGRVHGLLWGSSYPLSTGEYWQKNLTRYQKRYLQAIETLAKVRKLNVNIQFNIATKGGKQVNVGSMPNKGK